MKSDPDFACRRERMVKEQIEARDIHDTRVLDALHTVPRHIFVLPQDLHHAYADNPLPIGNQQTISQPYIVALMSELLELKGSEVVLEVGTGSGYQAAVLAHLASQVHTIERFADLAHRAEKILQQLGLDNVHVHIGDGSLGLPELAPFDGVIVTAAAPAAPPALLNQLADQGRLVIPVGSYGNQVLQRWQRTNDQWNQKEILPVAFVPLIGEQGWEEK